jgi:hypothetical protein
MACPRPRPIPLLCKKARSKEGDASKRRDGTWSANCRPNASVTHKHSNAACEREKKKKALPLLDFDSNPQSQGTRQKPSEKKKELSSEAKPRAVVSFSIRASKQQSLSACASLVAVVLAS